MAVSGLWMLVVFYGLILALQREVSPDLFILLGIVGSVAFVTTK